MAYFSTTQADKIRIIARLQTILTSAADYMKNRQIYRATIVGLSSLSNRDVTDMGVNRSMIKGLTRSSAGLA